ncbi:MAG: hypothetical protein E5Y60_02445 [Mesorhizobium sp.]|nr:MAG: hypothetical protein E5Y60_02445 [Mesorhizobium sp.]
MPRASLYRSNPASVGSHSDSGKPQISTSRPISRGTTICLRWTEILELGARRRTQAGARNEESPMVASPDT